MNHPIATLCVATSLVLTLSLPATSISAENTGDTQPQTMVVTSGNVGGAVRLGGSVVPEQIVNLTAQMPGDVAFVAGQEGDAFRQGDILVSLDTKSLLAKREQVLSQIASADAGYRNAVVQYRQELVNPNSQSNSMLGGAPGLFGMFSDPARSMLGQGDPDAERTSSLYAHRVQIETAANGLTQANAALRELDESLKNANSVAPFNGVIVKKMVEQGDIVQPGMPLVSFADVTRLQIRVEVPTRLLKVIEPGNKVQARIDGEPGLVPVTVDRIFPMAEAGGHTTTVKFALPPGLNVRSGTYAEVIVPDPASRSLPLPVVPGSAVVWRGSLPAVYKVTPDGRIKLRLIRVDEQSPDGSYSVISGIKTGDRILVDPTATPAPTASPAPSAVQ
jgi:multidrug efflux pump subunit AcrA (membrane-fusion protein)